MKILRWLPAAFVMLVIFLLSSLPSPDLPNFNWADKLIKKTGHILEYAVLCRTFWRGFSYRQDKRWSSWILALLYAITDEFHQSFVPGRHASVWDILLFDNLGALMSLWIAEAVASLKQSG